MRYNSEDGTLSRNYKLYWKKVILEYDLIKKRQHTRYRFVGELLSAHGLKRQVFYKVYNRYKDSNCDESSLLPQKRGPKWHLRRPDGSLLVKEVLAERLKGLNKYEICSILKIRHGRSVISPSGVYNICKRNGLNILRKQEKEVKAKIIKDNPGELGHIDCHYVDKGVIENDKKQYYLVCVVDSCSRIAWAEVVEDIKSLTVMFATMRLFNLISTNYDIKFEKLLSDNGAEFASKKNPNQHPFERMLIEVGVKHGYTRPYRPQTNGKVERFWRTIKDDLIGTTTFEDIEEFRKHVFELFGDLDL